VGQAGHHQVVLGGEGGSVQRPERRAAQPSRLAGPRRRAGAVLVQDRERVDAFVQRGDAGKLRFERLDRGDLLAFEGVGELREGKERQV